MNCNVVVCKRQWKYVSLRNVWKVYRISFGGGDGPSYIIKNDVKKIDFPLRKHHFLGFCGIGSFILIIFPFKVVW